MNQRVQGKCKQSNTNQDNSFFQRKKELPWVGLEPTTLHLLGIQVKGKQYRAHHRVVQLLLLTGYQNLRRQNDLVARADVGVVCMVNFDLCRQSCWFLYPSLEQKNTLVTLRYSCVCTHTHTSSCVSSSSLGSKSRPW